MKILVTGVAGFIGMHSAKKLLDDGHEIIGIDNLNDYYDQLQQLKNMGGISAMMDKLPGMGTVPQQVREQVNDDIWKRQIVIIESMTLKERRDPDLINTSRKERIAKGSGSDLQEVNKMLKLAVN